MFRVILGIVFFVSSTTLITLSTLGPWDEATTEILGNVGTEIFGILVTIALVDWVLERRRRQDRGRELAWGVLHAIEHAVWVWQGGPRHMGTNELLGIVGGIRGKDGFAPFTECLFQNVGLQCRSILQMEPSAVGSLPGLGGTLKDLVSLATIRDLPESTRIRTVSEILETSVVGLSRILNQPTERMPSGLIWHRDATADGQEGRYEQILSAPGVPIGSPRGGAQTPGPLHGFPSPAASAPD